MILKYLVFGILLFIGILLALYALISIIIKVIFHFKEASDLKSMQSVIAQKTSLRKSLDFKIQMHNEETSNHEFDSTTTYNKKIKLGTKELNKYKIKNGTLLSKDYTGMKNHE